jgi:hypothetical protein
MTMYLFETNSLATVTTYLMSVPESLGLLAFGIGLILIAVVIRSLLAKHENTDSPKGQLSAEGRGRR